MQQLYVDDLFAPVEIRFSLNSFCYKIFPLSYKTERLNLYSIFQSHDVILNYLMCHVAFSHRIFVKEEFVRNKNAHVHCPNTPADSQSIHILCVATIREKKRSR